MKVDDLTNEQLDYWVAKAIDWDMWNGDSPQACAFLRYTPSTEWSICGPLIRRFDIGLYPCPSNAPRKQYYAQTNYGEQWRDYPFAVGEGSTPQQAICRAVIKSIYGEEVEDVSEA